MTRGVGAIVLLALVLLRSRDARAQDDRAVVADARHWFESGVALLEGGRYADAAADLRRSLALRESPVVLYNLALASRGAGAHRAAIAALQRFIALSSDESLRRDALTLVRESTAALVHVRLIARGSPGALFVDGSPIARDDASRVLELDPGSHRFEARRAGYEPVARTDVFAPGSHADVALDASLHPQPGSLAIETGLGSAVIRVDGVVHGTSRAVVELPAGTHRIDVTAAGRSPTRRTVDVAPGARTTVTLSPMRASTSAAPWIAAGAGVVVVAAIVTTLLLVAPWDTGPHGTWDTVTAEHVRP